MNTELQTTLRKRLKNQRKRKRKNQKLYLRIQFSPQHLKNFWKLDPSTEEILEQIPVFQEKNELQNDELLGVIFDSLFDKTILTHLDQKCKIYLLFKEKYKAEYYSSTLDDLECLCQQEDSVYSSINTIIEHFLQYQILDQDSLKVWYDNPSPTINADFSQQIRQQTKSLIEK